MDSHMIVAGYPRAGTTLLYNMLRETVKDYETFDREIKAEKARKKATKSRIISKRPTDITDAPRLKKTYPDIQFILCIRDPRAVLVSEHDHARGHYKISWDKSIKTTRRDGIVGRAPGFIERHNRVIKVPDPIIMYYENLVRDPQDQQKRLGELLEFEYTGSFIDVHSTAPPERLSLQLNGVRPVETSRIDAWKNHPQRIYQQFTQCRTLFDILQYWGYEQDNLWFNDIINQVKVGK